MYLMALYPGQSRWVSTRKKHSLTVFGLITKHACDRRTDGQNYDSQDHASIAASHGKNPAVLDWECQVTQVDLCNGHKMVCFVVVVWWFSSCNRMLMISVCLFLLPRMCQYSGQPVFTPWNLQLTTGGFCFSKVLLPAVHKLAYETMHTIFSLTCDG